MAITRTAPRYRLYALPGGPPARPGLIRYEVLGRTIEVEVWDLGIADFGSFVAEVPAPLVIGSVELVDGSWEKGFLCESRGVAGAKEITALGGWKEYLATRACSTP
jgi:allophanate hydrolase